MKITTANIAGRRTVPELVRVIDRERPDVVVVTEAARARAFLRGIPGYRLRQFTRRHGSEAPGIALLVRRGLSVDRRRLLAMRLSWVGPLMGKRHDGRRYPSARVDGVAVLGPHLPTANNKAAQAESNARVRRWLAAKPGPRIAAGDFNQLAEDVAELAESAGARLAVGTKVDHAVYVGCRHLGTTRHRKDQPEGMHGWITYRFDTKEKA